MRLSEIKRLIGNHSYHAEFLDSIEQEIRSYEHDFSKVGATLFINLLEDINWTVSQFDCQSLCVLYSTKKLRRIELAYIADALQLAENVSFESNDLASTIAEMTDPEINGEFTIERASAIIKNMS